MVLREFADILGISRSSAGRIAPLIPGAHREQLAPGQVPGWILPDDAIDYVNAHPEVLEAARAQAAESAAARAAAPSAPGLGRTAVTEEEADLRRARLRLERERLEVDALEIRARKEELERRRGGGQVGGVDATTLLLLDRLNAVERKLEGGKGNGGLADAVKALAPALTLLLQGRSGGLEVKDLVALLDRQSDAVGLLTKLRESGLLPPASADGGAALGNAGQLLDAVLDLVERAGPLVGKSRGDNGVLQAIERLAERLGPDILKTWQDAIAARERIERIRAGHARGTAATAAPAAVAQLDAELARAAAALDDGFFPRLVDRLTPMFGGRGREFLAAIQRGEVPEPEIFSTFAGVGFTLTPQVKQYLRRFVNWLRSPGARPRPATGTSTAARPAAPAPPTAEPAGSPGAPDQPPPGSVVGRCVGCGEEYVFETEAIWEAEKDDPCSKCGGQIERVSR